MVWMGTICLKQGDLTRQTAGEHRSGWVQFADYKETLQDKTAG